MAQRVDNSGGTGNKVNSAYPNRYKVQVVKPPKTTTVTQPKVTGPAPTKNFRVSSPSSGSMEDRAGQMSTVINAWRSMQRSTGAATPTTDSSGSSYSGSSWGGGGGGGGGSATTPGVTWTPFTLEGVTAPTWWKALKPSEVNDQTEYLSSLNMLIPFLSAEDQKNVATTLYQMDATNFAHLNPEAITVNPANSVDTATRDTFTGSERASTALTALSELAKAVGKTDAELGPGYRYLRSILDTSKQYGGTGTNRQTRRQYTQMMSALDPLYSQSSSGDLSPYGSVARMLAQPFFSGGQLTPVTKRTDGTYSFGTGNKQLF